jgi:hypothetical protein
MRQYLATTMAILPAFALTTVSADSVEVTDRIQKDRNSAHAVVGASVVSRHDSGSPDQIADNRTHSPSNGMVLRDSTPGAAAGKIVTFFGAGPNTFAESSTQTYRIAGPTPATSPDYVGQPSTHDGNAVGGELTIRDGAEIVIELIPEDLKKTGPDFQPDADQAFEIITYTKLNGNPDQLEYTFDDALRDGFIWQYEWTNTNNEAPGAFVVSVQNNQVVPIPAPLALPGGLMLLGGVVLSGRLKGRARHSSA